MAQMRVIRSPETSNANTVAVTPSCWATRPGWPLTVRSRNVTLPGARPARSTRYRAICSPPSMGRSEESHAHRLVEGDPVGRVDGGAARPPADPFRRFGQRLGDPLAHIALPPGPGRAEQIQADAAGDRRQPGTGGFDGVLLLRGHGVPAGVGLLDGILGLGQGAQQPVRQIDQLTPLARVLMLPPTSLGRICPHQFAKAAHRNVRPTRLTFHGIALSYW
jgi:hypothetical protein